MVDWLIIFLTLGIECESILISVKLPRPKSNKVAIGSPPNSPQIETFFLAALALSNTCFIIFIIAGL